jgi:IS30 family transposase
MKHYTPLTQEQRYHISAFLKAGNFQNTIADLVGVHKSTISRELARNCGERGYRPKQADELADKKAGGTLYTHLRHSGKKHKKRYGRHDRRGQIKNRVSIEERPKVVEKKNAWATGKATLLSENSSRNL